MLKKLHRSSGWSDSSAVLSITVGGSAEFTDFKFPDSVPARMCMCVSVHGCVCVRVVYARARAENYPK